MYHVSAQGVDERMISYIIIMSEHVSGTYVVHFAWMRLV